MHGMYLALELAVTEVQLVRTLPMKETQAFGQQEALVSIMDRAGLPGVAIVQASDQYMEAVLLIREGAMGNGTAAEAAHSSEEKGICRDLKQGSENR